MTGGFVKRTIIISSGGSSAAARRSGNASAGIASAMPPSRRRHVCIAGIGNLPCLCHAFSSRLSSLKKRQSVFSAMILFGSDLIMPSS